MIINERVALISYSGIVEAGASEQVQVCIPLGAYRILHALAGGRGLFKSSYYVEVAGDKFVVSDAQFDELEALLAQFFFATRVVCCALPAPGECWNLGRGILVAPNQIFARFILTAFRSYGVEVGDGFIGGNPTALNSFTILDVERDDPDSAFWDFQIADINSVPLYASSTESPIGQTFQNVGLMDVSDESDFRITLTFDCVEI